ncbi:hypothetical protein [Streptomyces sp. AC602_WCS936]|uniref:hypothetical protein n=1 Tax=Streptomyces sp. AC602_WCS936 TaxID=2823685 RepID=UPI001C262B80|nr:hypothetical protein [Streptomyces sp. AC602_WCS936]
MARNGINKRELDKWAKGLVKEANKSLERAARRNPSRVPVQFETTTTVGGALDGGAIASSPNLAGLLMWLDAYGQQHPGEYADVARFVEAHELAEDASVLAFQLEQRGLADLTRTWSDAAPHVHLTDEGRVAVHTLKRLQTDRAARLRHTMDAFLRWLYDIAGTSRPPTRGCSSPLPGRSSPEPCSSKYATTSSSLASGIDGNTAPAARRAASSSEPCPVSVPKSARYAWAPGAWMISAGGLKRLAVRQRISSPSPGSIDSTLPW